MWAKLPAKKEASKKFKFVSSEWFSENVCKVVSAINVLDLDGAI